MNTAKIELKKLKISDLIFKIQYQLKPFLNKTDSLNSIISKVNSSESLNLMYLPILEIFYEYLSENDFKSGQFSETKALQLFVKKMNWTLPIGSEDYLKDNHIFEIYDHQGLQIYRSFNFFKISSYSITDILTNHWWNLYDRNLFIAKSLADQALKIFNEQSTDILHLNLQPHMATEKWSERISEVQMLHDCFVPIQDHHNQVVAILSPYRILNFQFKKPAVEHQVEI